MSNATFPILSGLGWSVIKTPQWRTKVQESANGKEYRSAFFSQPKYHINLSFEILRADSVNLELQTLMGFFNNRQGSYDSFLYTDPTDNSVTAQGIGTGTGAQTIFSLLRNYGSFVESVMNINVITGIYDNGVPVVQGAGAGKYTIDSFGFVTFGTAPIAGHVLTWTGTYFYRCRFAKDASEFNNFMYQLWTLKSLDMVGCLGAKI